MCKTDVGRLAAEIDYRQTFHIKEPSRLPMELKMAVLLTHNSRNAACRPGV